MTHITNIILETVLMEIEFAVIIFGLIKIN